MVRGILADRRELDYKLSFMALCLALGPQRATDVQVMIKRVKDRLLRVKRVGMAANGIDSATGLVEYLPAEKERYSDGAYH